VQSTDATARILFSAAILAALWLLAWPLGPGHAPALAAALTAVVAWTIAALLLTRRPGRLASPWAEAFTISALGAFAAVTWTIGLVGLPLFVLPALWLALRGSHSVFFLSPTADQSSAMMSAALQSLAAQGIVLTDSDGLITFFSVGAERMLGYQAESVIGTSVLDYFDQPHSLLANGSWSLCPVNASRQPITLRVTRLRDEAGQDCGWAAIAPDMGSESQAQQRFERLFEESPHGAVLVGGNGLIERVNPAFTAMIGAEESQFSGQSIRALPFIQGNGPEFLLTDLRENRRYRTEVERGLRHASGQVVHVLASAVALRSDAGDLEGVLASIIDISEIKRYQRQLAHQAEHDPLTGLANRRKFEGELTSHMNRCRRYGATGALLILDLDNFKQVNDTLGHGAGDQLIISLGSILRQRMRSGDVVSRLGGDEFAILLPQADRAAAETVAQSIVDLVREQVCLLDQDQPHRLTVSIGVVLVDDAERSPGEIISTADMTMYDAKETGRDCYVIHDSARFAVPRTGARIAWNDRIARALQNDKFVIHAQPVQDLRSGKITGAELLIRMVGDAGQLIMPGRFLYIAERTHLIHELDMWVVSQAVELLAEIQQIDPGFSIEVNLSGRSVGHPALADHITQSIKGIDPHGLVLEITETAAVSDIEAARRFAEQIGDLGCRFALDDFGAGFGSFYYLKHLLFDFVKIDGEFVAKAPTNPTDQLIVSSIVGIARGLGKETIAEFVADAEIMEMVTDLGVDHAQGYHVGRPDAPPVLLDRIRDQLCAPTL
jgi:diguanylate cyclase (GGDEF)-like protein/PAS domain S-box-containing protein